MASTQREHSAQKILTREQRQLLSLVSEEPYLCKRFYFTGGTPLSAFYLHHRMSEDIDLFSEDEIHLSSLRVFIGKVQRTLRIRHVDYTRFLGLHAFQLTFPNGTVLKVDFNYYPFPRIEKGMRYHNLEVDSILDIAANKVHTIAMKPRARDFIDIYFILQARQYALHDLLMHAKAKFDWHIDPIQLGAQLLAAREMSDFPRMLKKIDHREWKQFFVGEARKLKKDIFK